MKRIVLGLWIGMWSFMSLGAEPAPQSTTPLPAPDMKGGRPLMQVLHDRKSTREFTTEAISTEQLANLLWAGFGVNRPEIQHRTAPCTMNLQSIDIYVATTTGAYRYDADKHHLETVSKEDVRRFTGGQDYVKTAPLALLYIADHAKMEKVKPEERDFYTAADAGFIGQNVYLYCASEALGCVVHMPGDRAALAEKLKLRPEQKVVLVHTVGHPLAK